MVKTIILNKKEYSDTGIFVEQPHAEYFNLKIYNINTLEKEAGLLSDIAEAYLEEGKECIYKIYKNKDHEGIEFLKDNLRNFKKSGNIIGYIDDDYTGMYELDFKAVLCKESNELNNLFTKIVVVGLSKVLYIADFLLFNKHFWYYFKNNQFCYDNLICYTMIIKNGGKLLEQVLTENLNIIDRWCILDTGSTDGSQEIIKRVLKDKKGKLFEEPFVNFKVSRNRCLELAGYTCKFICMLDDTYSIRGDLRNFLTITRGDQFSDSFSLMIQSDDTEYFSNRIIKSSTNLRYIHTIHEVITDKCNKNVTVPYNEAIIFDHRADYMEKRTNDRKQFDLELLFKEYEDNPDDPRALYYIAQTYGCIGDEINKAKYFELRINHRVEGYFQEKIDACFELARTYNFKIDCFTKLPLTNLTDAHWKRCKELYLQAYNLDKKRPDSLYFIGIHYYLEKDYNSAYTYFKQAFDIGYPVNSQYSLKPTLSFHFLPRFLTECCYIMNDFQTGLDSAKLFLNETKFNKPGCEFWNVVNNWYSIHTKLLQMGPVNDNPKKHNIFCIVTDGGWSEWTGKDILTKGLGGSETWVIEMATHIKKSTNFNVVVFCNTSVSEIYEGVGYNPVKLFPEFIANNTVEYCIISRFTEYIPVAIKGHAQNVGVIFHDLLSPEIIIPVHDKLRWVFGLTEWHAKYIHTIFPNFKVNYIHYGIDHALFKPGIKIKNSFIYSSFPNRGLVILLKMWPKIIKNFPDSVLNIYSDVDHKWANQVALDEMNEIRALLKINKKGINYKSWVDKNTLAKAWETAEYWLYPCKFEETFCLTASEAAASKTFAISNNLAALSETIGNRGLIVHGDALTSEWQETILSELFLYMSGKKDKSPLVELNYAWSLTHTWKAQAEQLSNMIINKKYWYKIKEIHEYLFEYTKDFKQIVDIGCGPSPLENANITIDCGFPATYKIDVEKEPLPLTQIDFIYTRHLLEDLKDPRLLLSEIKRIGTHGYIETPSVIAECSKGVDAGVADYYGYIHHNSILWTDKNTFTLKIIPKITKFIETFNVNLKEYLLDPYLWNNYYFFNPECPFKYAIIDVTDEQQYHKLLLEAIEHTILNTSVFKKLIHGVNHSQMLNWTNDVPGGSKEHFENILKSLKISSKILEIGTYAGTSVIEMLKIVPESTAIVIDAWESYHEHDNVINNDTITEEISKINVESVFYKNIKPFEKRIRVLKGKSSNKLVTLLSEQASFDFIYVDASHKCLDVFLDATLAWKLLKIGGVIGFDDYLFNKGDTLNSPYEAIEYFKEQNKNNFVTIHSGYRLFLKKIN